MTFDSLWSVVVSMIRSQGSEELRDLLADDEPLLRAVGLVEWERAMGVAPSPAPEAPPAPAPAVIPVFTTTIKNRDLIGELEYAIENRGPNAELIEAGMQARTLAGLTWAGPPDRVRALVDELDNLYDKNHGLRLEEHMGSGDYDPDDEAHARDRRRMEINLGRKLLRTAKEWLKAHGEPLDRVAEDIRKRAERLAEEAAVTALGAQLLSERASPARNAKIRETIPKLRAVTGSNSEKAQSLASTLERALLETFPLLDEAPTKPALPTGHSELTRSAAHPARSPAERPERTLKVPANAFTVFETEVHELAADPEGYGLSEVETEAYQALAGQIDWNTSRIRVPSRLHTLVLCRRLLNQLSNSADAEAEDKDRSDRRAARAASSGLATLAIAFAREAEALGATVPIDESDIAFFEDYTQSEDSEDEDGSVVDLWIAHPVSYRKRVEAAFKARVASQEPEPQAAPPSGNLQKLLRGSAYSEHLYGAELRSKINAVMADAWRAGKRYNDSNENDGMAADQARSGLEHALDLLKGVPLDDGGEGTALHNRVKTAAAQIRHWLSAGVATTILQQLGGARAQRMIGAKDIRVVLNGVRFSFMRSAGRPNMVTITLDPSDTYTVEFGSTRAGNYKQHAIHHDIYGEDLPRIFESATGLRLHL